MLVVFTLVDSAAGLTIFAAGILGDSAEDVEENTVVSVKRNVLNLVSLSKDKTCTGGWSIMKTML